MNNRHIFFGKLLGPLVIAGALMLTLNHPVSAEQPYDEDTYGPAAPILWTKPVTAVIFNHKRHTMEAGLECDSCHDGIFQMEAGSAEGNDDFTMDSLYKGKYCGACHDGQTAFASNSRCTSCHIGVQAYQKRIGGQKAPKGH
ncbi:MAG: cytochrome c3 family protein [Desulfobulbaceae bacterium]|nr:cytochrome c3 family protein [Desulfobulbaceae bacterium]